MDIEGTERPKEWTRARCKVELIRTETRGEVGRRLGGVCVMLMRMINMRRMVKLGTDERMGMPLVMLGAMLHIKRL